MTTLLNIEQQLILLSSQIQQLIDQQPKPIMKAVEAAHYLGIAKSTLYKHTSRFEIAHLKPNGKLLSFRKDDLDEWLNSKRIPSNRELVNEYFLSIKKKRSV